ncbi:hypothetical protein FHR72_002731 [Mycolicibacterium iranicum]|uniref:Uncharacterized protein n=1 Tax=Mycolicibacterium iranicum TaxID=912594 RepID=A0A839Q6G3_MYCIR|nr:hypothetical protein [Mycolicibacterium iranicum]MBB2991247.1 hypothetical protein [Mycolicibacterium iranicum]
MNSPLPGATSLQPRRMHQHDIDGHIGRCEGGAYHRAVDGLVHPVGIPGSGWALSDALAAARSAHG